MATTNSTKFAMTEFCQVGLSLYSRFLLGSASDPSTVTKMQSMLFRVGLVDNVTRSLRVKDWREVLAVFRVVNFTSADLVICRDFDVDDILRYENPCNLRRALDGAISAISASSFPDISRELIKKVSENFDGGVSSFDIPSADSTLTQLPHITQAVENFNVSSTTAGYSLFAKRALARGETVIALKESDAISVLSSFRDAEFPGESLFLQGLHPDTIFLLYLIHMRDNQLSLANNVHRDFFACQPESYDTLFELPLEVVRAIDEPEILESVVSQNAFLESICKSLEPPPKFTDMLWAKSLCTSRAFSLAITPKTDLEKRVLKDYYSNGLVTTILPGIHFINHDFRGQLTTPEISPDGSITVKAFADVAEGSEVFLIYGGFTNKELMLNYGFLVPGNPYDTIERPNGAIVRRGALNRSNEEIRIPPRTMPEVPDQYKALVEGYLADRDMFLKFIV